jgi:hypothetical protein
VAQAGRRLPACLGTIRQLLPLYFNGNNHYRIGHFLARIQRLGCWRAANAAITAADTQRSIFPG